MGIIKEGCLQPIHILNPDVPVLDSFNQSDLYGHVALYEHPEVKNVWTLIAVEKTMVYEIPMGKMVKICQDYPQWGKVLKNSARELILKYEAKNEVFSAHRKAKKQ